MRYDGPVIDCDVHNTWAKPGDLIGYLPPDWREYVQSGDIPINSPAMHFPDRTGTARRLDSFGPNGETPGSDLSLMAAQLLDPARIERAVLCFGDGEQAAVRNPHFANVLTRAANDWLLDRWLNAGDNRLFGSILLNAQVPAWAVSEIERLGSNDRFVQVLIQDNGLGLPLGHPVYHELYAACQDANLPVGIHLGGAFHGGPAQLTAAGMPASRLEFLSLYNQAGQHHLASLVVHGVFDKFPRLKVVLMECGVNWVPWLFWQLDGRYKEICAESARLERLPSEYLRENIRLSLQPIEVGEKPNQLSELWDAFGMDDLIFFASDYPHWDADEIAIIDRTIKKGALPRIFYANARSWYRWPDDIGLTRNADPANALHP